MNGFDIQSLITTIDNLIFSYTGEHLDDVQSEILEGVINHQKYTEIAKTHHRSDKYVKDVAGKLWKTLSEILGEEVNKANLKSSLRRYYYNVSHNFNVINPVQINQGSICNKLPENQLQKQTFDEEYKLEIAQELIKEGLTVEQISRVLKLPLELVKDEIKKDQ
ncbi:MAG: ATPase [Crocosphaera sp.]